jgi:hypothetical protein
MKKDGYKSLNIQIETHRLIKVEAAATGKEMREIVDEAWAAYLLIKGGTKAPEVQAVPMDQYPYRPENRPWHERLEMTLNDPDEALGIQKNLEWAERTVTAKPPPRKRVNGS